MTLKKAIGCYWGPPPYQIRWILTGMVRPMISYGSYVWGQHASECRNKAKLKRVQRLALMAMGHMRKSTPTDGMEIIMDIIRWDIIG